MKMYSLAGLALSYSCVARKHEQELLFSFYFLNFLPINVKKCTLVTVECI